MNYSAAVDPTFEVFPSTNLTAFENTPVTTMTICVLIFSLLFGLPTHSYVIWLIITRTGNGVASEFLNLNLTVCEIIFCLFALIYLQKLISPSHQELVRLITLRFLTGNIITVRPLFQCLMCVERYLAVVHPVTFLKYKPLRYRVICCTVAWIAGLGSCFFCIFILMSLKIFMWFSFVQFLLFFSIQLFCLVAVLRALKQSGPGERGREREEENHMKRRAFKIIVILTVTMLIIVLPFIISRFLNILLQKDVEEVSVFSLFCFVLGGFVPAVLYLRRVGKLPFFKPP
ncbi:G-protein coupled receptor 4 [Anabarilius grahami]|uniref:G-protein coupled receptor 4 n=1 Tax=Anabarilius grahami TaxID=495550 RepID=A0A3N0YMH9_ANAGA|nr:G-protein coupled receptor 4 [Anabarilius grahami]